MLKSTVNMKITKYIIPVAGMGTRFLPATKAIPKEMLPVVDKPLIQYVVDEAAAAGAEEIILVTHPDKHPLKAHFSKNEKLEEALEKSGKDALLQKVYSILPAGVTVTTVDQMEPLGLGHAVLCAREIVGDEPFGVILPDVLIYDDKQGCMEQMVQEFEQQGESIIGVEEVPLEDVDKYGIVSLANSENVGSKNRKQRMSGVVEKPAPESAPSRLSVVGRYILTPRVMEILENTKIGAGGEIQLTDAIATLIGEEPVFAYTFKGESYDCGCKYGYLRANIEYGLRDLEVSEQLQRLINLHAN